MKDIINSIRKKLFRDNFELSCGNCWGHQEYSNQFVEKPVDIARSQKDNFISRFVKKYIRNTK